MISTYRELCCAIVAAWAIYFNAHDSWWGSTLAIVCVASLVPWAKVADFLWAGIESAAEWHKERTAKAEEKKLFQER